MTSARKIPMLILTLTLGAAAAAPGLAAAATPEADAARGDIQKTFGFVPGFFKLVPDLALPGAWMDFKGLAVNPMTALTRKWSTFLNGIQTDENKFRSEIGQLVTNMKKMMASGAAPAPSKPMPV